MGPGSLHFGCVPRDAGWFAATIGLLRQESERQTLWRQLAVAAGILAFANLGFALSGAAFETGLGLRLSPAAVDLAVSIMGLILTENLMLNIVPPRRWSVRLMAIGLTALFGYNIILRIPQFLSGEAIEGFVAAQPVVYLLALPLFVVTGVRNNSLKLQAHSSRNVRQILLRDPDLRRNPCCKARRSPPSMYGPSVARRRLRSRSFWVSRAC